MQEAARSDPARPSPAPAGNTLQRARNAAASRPPTRWHPLRVSPSCGLKGGVGRPLPAPCPLPASWRGGPSPSRRSEGRCRSGGDTSEPGPTSALLPVSTLASEPRRKDFAQGAEVGSVRPQPPLCDTSEAGPGSACHGQQGPAASPLLPWPQLPGPAAPALHRPAPSPREPPHTPAPPTPVVAGPLVSHQPHNT